MALKVFAITNKIDCGGVSLTIPQSKINKLSKLIEKKFNYEGNNVSIPFEDLTSLIVPVKFDKDVKLKLFKNTSYSYYLEVGAFSKGKSYYNFVCVTNCKTFETDDKQTKEFQPWSDSNNVWKVLPGYGINAYWSQHYSRGQNLYVDSKDLAKALIIDASVQYHGQKLRRKELDTVLSKMKKSVDKLFEQFPNNHRDIIDYIKENY